MVPVFLVLLFLAAISLMLSTKYTAETYSDQEVCRAKNKIEPRNEKERQLLEMARGLVKELLEHLETQKKSNNAKEILHWMTSDNVYLFDHETVGARIKRNRKKRKACIFINPNINDNHIKGRLQSKICHEVAHLTGKGHDMKWRDTKQYLLNLTSRDLNWKNELACGACIKYKFCNKKMCPRCTWTEGNHMTCKPLSKRGVTLKK